MLSIRGEGEYTSSPIGMHTLAGRAFDNHVTSSFYLLSSGSVRPEGRLCTVCLCGKFGVDGSSRLTFSEDRQTDTQTHKVTDATDHPTHASVPPAWV